MKKKIKMKEKALAVKINESEVDRLDYWADKAGINRSQLVRNLIGMGLDDLDLLDSIGFVTLALKGVDLLESVKSSFRKKNYKLKDGKLIIDL